MRDYHFQPGNTESTGRPPGSPNKRTNELRYRLQNRGEVDPADYCSQIVSSPNEPTELKLAVANYLLPYLYPKRGAVPTPRFVEEPFQLPFLEPKTIEQANANIAYLSAQKIQGLISVDDANSAIADNQSFIDNLIAEEELKFKISPPEHRDTTLTIRGGLPALPGTSIVMPVLDGHATNGNGHALAAPTDAVTAIEAAPKAQDP